MIGQDYEKQVEERFGKPLKEIMYELCVVQDLVPTEGADKLDVPKETFIRWRSRFRYGPKQRMYDAADRKIQEMKKQYVQEANLRPVDRAFNYDKDITLEGLEELINRKNEIYKKNLIESDDNSMISIKISMNEMILDVIKEYRSGKLMKEVKWLIDINK